MGQTFLIKSWGKNSKNFDNLVYLVFYIYFKYKFKEQGLKKNSALVVGSAHFQIGSRRERGKRKLWWAALKSYAVLPTMYNS